MLLLLRNLSMCVDCVSVSLVEGKNCLRWVGMPRRECGLSLLQEEGEGGGLMTRQEMWPRSRAHDLAPAFPCS